MLWLLFAGYCSILIIGLIGGDKIAHSKQMAEHIEKWTEDNMR